MQSNFIKKKANELYLLDTSVENIFISEYMAGAPAEYVKIYLFALMYANAGYYMDNESIAKQLALEEEDVLKAWTYWESMGVVIKHFEDPKDKFHYCVEFINLKEQLYCPQHKRSRKEKTSVAENKLVDVQVKELFENIEKIKGKLLSGKEPVTVLSWMEDLEASPELILYAYSYCKNMRKKDSVNYVGAVLKEWIAKDLRNKEDVEKYLQEVDSRHYQYKRVMQALGFNRNATEQEKLIMDRWFQDMGCTLEKVLEACAKTSGISNPNINYVNKILENWKGESRQSGRESTEQTAGSGRTVSAAVVFRYYDMLREKAENEAAEHREEIYEKLPEIKRIDEEMRSLGIRLSRIMVSGAPNAKEQLKNFRLKIDALAEEKAFKLTENNFPMDYMEVSYKCSKCKDTGRNDMGERCSCFNERLSEAELWQNSSKKI